tara:strand:- start:59 stop:262 length:204 start_codon:yes stop_codon:yes gene_type:complete
MSSKVDKMNLGQLNKFLRPKIIKKFGEKEWKFMRDEFKGPGAIDRARQYYKDMLTKLNKKKSTKKVT